MKKIFFVAILFGLIFALNLYSADAAKLDLETNPPATLTKDYLRVDTGINFEDYVIVYCQRGVVCNGAPDTNNIFVGTTAADTIITKSGNKVVFGFAGKDTITVENGKNVVIYAGDGPDNVTVDAMKVTAYLGDGTNTYVGGTKSGVHTVTGGPKVDKIFGSWGNDVIKGMGGDDLICGSGGADHLWGGDGKDSIYGNCTRSLALAFNFIFLEDRYFDSFDYIYGGNGDDPILKAGQFKPAKIFGNDGDDTIEGGQENDILHGGKGNDTIRGNSGDDQIDGGPGDDILFGGDGADKVKGNSGNDRLYSFDGNHPGDRYVDTIDCDGTSENDANYKKNRAYYTGPNNAGLPQDKVQFCNYEDGGWNINDAQK